MSFPVNILATRGLSLRKHPFLLALRRWGRFARNVPSGEERGETDVFQASVDFVCLFFFLTPTPFPVARSALSNIPSGLHSDKVRWLVLFLAKYYAHMATFW